GAPAAHSPRSGVSARQTPRPWHGDDSASMPMEGLDQLPLAQLGQGPAHRHAGNRVLAGKLILSRQGRAERVGAISDPRGYVVGNLSPDGIIGRPPARHAGNSRSPPSQTTTVPGSGVRDPITLSDRRGSTPSAHVL